MKRIAVEQRVFDAFEDYRGGDEETRALGRLLRTSAREADRIAFVMLEDHWLDLKVNPAQASNAPFLEGVCRLVDNLRSYRLNFYDAGSLRLALQAMASVPEQRVILYIGAHGTGCKVGRAHAMTVMKIVADFSSRKKIEGVFLSSCSVGGNDAALIEAFKGGAHWLFAYKSNVDFLGSVQVEAAILEQLSYAGPETVENEDKLAKVFGKALHCFNPDWEIGSAPYPALRDAVRLVTRGKNKKTPIENTKKMLDHAW